MITVVCPDSHRKWGGGGSSLPLAIKQIASEPTLWLHIRFTCMPIGADSVRPMEHQHHHHCGKHIVFGCVCCIAQRKVWADTHPQSLLSAPVGFWLYQLGSTDLAAVLGTRAGASAHIAKAAQSTIADSGGRPELLACTVSSGVQCVCMN
jgi:hypothetical protein